MTVVLDKNSGLGASGWAAMPGWGIVADLTPPELRARRALAVTRRWIAGALALVALLCVGGYVEAVHSASDAQSTLAATQLRTVSLQHQVDAHSSVTQVQAATSTLDAQLSQLFAGDVDVSSLVRDLADALPAGMEVTSIDVSLTTSAASSVTLGSIGTVTLAGSSQNLSDLTRYVLALQSVEGVTQVIPSTNAVSGGSTSWTLVLQLTGQRYGHRFASAPSPTAPTAAGTTPAATSTGGN